MASLKLPFCIKGSASIVQDLSFDTGSTVLIFSAAILRQLPPNRSTRILLIGVSRVIKTKLSFYLRQTPPYLITANLARVAWVEML